MADFRILLLGGVATLLLTAAVAAQENEDTERALQQQIEREVEAQQAAETELRARREAQAVQELERERARRELALARTQLEEAARELAISSQPNAAYVNQMRYVLNSDVERRGRPRIGALTTPAEGGVLITQVTPGGAAETAGLSVGDVIEQVGEIELVGEEGDDAADMFDRFNAALDAVESGESVTVVVERRGETLEFDVSPAEPVTMAFRIREPFQEELIVLNERLEDLRVTMPNMAVTVEQAAPAMRVFRSFEFAGAPWGDMELVPLTESLGRYFDTDEGLLVISAPTDETIGIEDGDVILAIGDRTPSSPEHALRILSSFESGETIEFSLMRDGRRASVDYEVPERSAGPAPIPVAPVFR